MFWDPIQSGKFHLGAGLRNWKVGLRRLHVVQATGKHGAVRKNTCLAQSL